MDTLLAFAITLIEIINIEALMTSASTVYLSIFLTSGQPPVVVPEWPVSSRSAVERADISDQGANSSFLSLGFGPMV
jgi:hypothetical protein